MHVSRSTARPQTVAQRRAKRRRLGGRPASLIAALALMCSSAVALAPASLAEDGDDSVSVTQEATPTSTPTKVTESVESVEPTESAEPTESEGGDSSPVITPTLTEQTDTAAAEASDDESDSSEQSHMAAEPLDAGVQAPVCTAGYVYALSANGQMQQVGPNGSVTNLGSAAPRVSSFNGLGIGSGGDSVYAYERSTSSGNSVSSAAVWKYDTATGTWSSTRASVNSNNSGGTIQFVAGAVSLDNGRFYLGGFSSNGNLFRIWEYNPSTNGITYKGYINTPGGSSRGTNNGDMAFDSAGNLFIVRGVDNQTTVFTITKSDLDAANGSDRTPITSSQSATVSTTSNVNGVAFDASGKAYLGASSAIESFNMPNWTGKQTFTTDVSSTDLASCSSPPTIEIEKEVIGGRVNSGDQFKLELKQSNALIGNATTTGSAIGVQEQRIGPLPTVRNVELSFSESAAGTTDMRNYASAYQCTVTHLDGTVQNLNQVNGTSGTITIPTTGEAVKCVFRNSPLTARVTIHKDVTDQEGKNPVAKQGWTVGESATATTGTVTSSPASTTQQTDVDGNASWNLNFSKYTDRATIKVSEATQDDYEFQSGQCTVTGLDGAVKTTELEGPDSTDLKGIAPGDQVDCSYVNRLQPSATLTLVKEVNNKHGGPAGVNDFNLAATPSDDEAISFKSGEKQDVDPGTYALSEADLDGYKQTSLTCEADGEELNVTDGSIKIAKSQNVTCTFVNEDQPGSVVWNKVDENGKALAGSEWKITGPEGSESAEIKVEDCVADNASACTGDDKDPVVGAFKINNLAWGRYTVVETKAPAGYKLSTTVHEFTISAKDLDYKFADAFVNEPSDGPVLPLTGGIGSDFYLIAGGGILLLGAGATAYAIKRRKATS